MNGLPTVHTVVSTDVVDSSQGGHPRHRALGQAAEATIRRAMDSWPGTDNWTHRHDGDGDTVLADALVPKAWLLANFLSELHIAIREYNRDKNTDNRLRLRVGMDSGDVTIDGSPDGRRPTGGIALVSAPRLRDCEAVRAAIDPCPDVTLAVAISDRLYQDVVPSGDRGLDPASFRKIDVSVKGKHSFIHQGWLYLPGTPNGPVEPAAATTIAPSEASLRPETKSARRQPEVSMRAENVSGMQVGIVHGGVIMNRQEDSAPSSRGVNVADIRHTVRRARSLGELDEDVFDAALEELDIAAAQLGRNDKLAKLALMRLRGIAADSTAVTIAVSRAVSMIGGRDV